jgi:phosphoribosylformimino-5-aminoimidazole carboxamide ribotide isomerase
VRILPVLDLLEGVVVRGVAGERDNYRPIQSQLTDQTSPVEVARAIRERFGLNEFYIADLDGILAQRPNFDSLKKLHDAGFQLMVDTGLRSIPQAEQLIECGTDSLIVCLETDPQQEFLRNLLDRFGPEKLIFSLDLKSGVPLGQIDDTVEKSSLKLCERIVEIGFSRLIVLDLAAVGVEAGPTTLELCRAIRAAHPQLELITGGGVRDMNDLAQLEQAGVDAALVAAGLHNGSLKLNEPA